MGGKTSWFQEALLDLIFFGTTIPNIAQNASSSPLTQYWISLHTDDPGEAGNQSTNEATDPDYERKPLARSGSGFSRTGNVVSLVSLLQFEPYASATEQIKYFGLGTDESGTGRLMYTGPVTANIPGAPGVVPQLAQATAVSED